MAIVTISAIEGVNIPTTGGTPITTITENEQYSGYIDWYPLDNPFLMAIVYYAYIYLTAKSGYTFTGLPGNFFTVAGSTSTTSASNLAGGYVTSSFPSTMALVNTYEVHPGDGKTTPSGSIEAIDAGTLASLYGLSAGEYSVGTDFAPTAIHLFPRRDGKYKNIKTALQDNELGYYYDSPAFMHTTRNGRYKNKHKIQPQYNATFRDKRGYKKGIL